MVRRKTRLKTMPNTNTTPATPTHAPTPSAATPAQLAAAAKAAAAKKAKAAAAAKAKAAAKASKASKGKGKASKGKAKAVGVNYGIRTAPTPQGKGKRSKFALASKVKVLTFAKGNKGPLVNPKMANTGAYNRFNKYIALAKQHGNGKFTVLHVLNAGVQPSDLNYGFKHVMLAISGYKAK